MIIGGLDPGNQGAAAFVDTETRKLVSFFELPTAKEGTKTYLDPVSFAIQMEMHREGLQFVVLEQVSAMVYTDKHGQLRGQGAAASFSFGRGFGMVEGVLAALHISTHKVRPAIWKSLLGLSASKSDSISLARKLFPDNLDDFKRKKDDGKAEAALLAWFGADRLWTGTTKPLL